MLENVLQSAMEFGYDCRGLVKSPLLGPKGNVEFLADLRYPGGNFDVQRLIGNCMKESSRQS